MKKLFTAFALAGAIALPALAQHNHGGAAQQQQNQRPAGGHGMHGQMHGQQGAQARTPADPASQAYAAANARMHKEMAIALTGNADADFVRGMIPHHQGAVDMAEIALKFGKDETVRKLATDIVAAQRTEIAQMQAWLAKNASMPASSNAKTVIEAYEEINKQMHADMNMPLTGDADADFMRGMIPHHEGAIEMAKVLLRYGADAELRKLGEAVVRSQTDEVVMMIGWLRGKGL
jgi:uncharacterized protein (DUF305 family)